MWFTCNIGPFIYMHPTFNVSGYGLLIDIYILALSQDPPSFSMLDTEKKVGPGRWKHASATAQSLRTESIELYPNCKTNHTLKGSMGSSSITWPVSDIKTLEKASIVSRDFRLDTWSKKWEDKLIHWINPINYSKDYPKPKSGCSCYRYN